MEETKGDRKVKDYIGPSIMVVGVMAFFIGLVIYQGEQSKSRKAPSPNKGVEVVCKTCGGTGETEQDVNLLMAKATYSIWLNGHSYGCEACNKFPNGPPCEVDRKKHKEIMDKYEQRGPKIDKAACPDCMGMGRYIQYDGYRFGRERE